MPIPTRSHFTSTTISLLKPEGAVIVLARLIQLDWHLQAPRTVQHHHRLIFILLFRASCVFVFISPIALYPFYSDSHLRICLEPNLSFQLEYDRRMVSEERR